MPYSSTFISRKQIHFEECASTLRAVSGAAGLCSSVSPRRSLYFALLSVLALDLYLTALQGYNLDLQPSRPKQKRILLEEEEEEEEKEELLLLVRPHALFSLRGVCSDVSTYSVTRRSRRRK
jgi:hypothetical protein